MFSLLRGVLLLPLVDRDESRLEVADLASGMAVIGPDRLVQPEDTWAVLHDPEAHNVLLLQRSSERARNSW